MPHIPICPRCKASVEYCECPSYVDLWARVAELEAKVKDLDSLIDFAEISIDEAVEAGWNPPSSIKATKCK